ncbi:MAG: hypothetical protein FWC16_01540 [Defluviitaleaceae bacterium]|nr:hypothetical protein [Defluviitaleaceae bacterium]MCL2273585.1 hypothetical protein [Defluviitaleaceae bacterium]
MAKYSGLISIPMKLRLLRKAATPVLPLPIKVSNIVSPSLERVRIKNSIKRSGFWVGCLPFRRSDGGATGHLI